MGGGNRYMSAPGRKVSGPSRYERGPVDQYRNRLGKREVHATSSVREREKFVSGHDRSFDRSSIRSFFHSRSFLLAIFALLVVTMLTAGYYASLKADEVTRMNEPPRNFASSHRGNGHHDAPTIPYQARQAIYGS